MGRRLIPDPVHHPRGVVARGRTAAQKSDHVMEMRRVRSGHGHGARPQAGNAIVGHQSADFGGRLRASEGHEFQGLVLRRPYARHSIENVTGDQSVM